MLEKPKKFKQKISKVKNYWEKNNQLIPQIFKTIKIKCKEDSKYFIEFIDLSLKEVLCNNF